jgi:hypothetical protein
MQWLVNAATLAGSHYPNVLALYLPLHNHWLSDIDTFHKPELVEGKIPP